MDCAATLYCRAVSRRRASKVDLTETMARAPRSWKSAYSAGVVASQSICADRAGTARGAPTEDAAKQDSAAVTARPPSLRSCADSTRFCWARAIRSCWRRFSAARSMAGGSPATIEAIALEYSEEENSRAAEDWLETDASERGSSVSLE